MSTDRHCVACLLSVSSQLGVCVCAHMCVSIHLSLSCQGVCVCVCVCVLVRVCVSLHLPLVSCLVVFQAKRNCSRGKPHQRLPQGHKGHELPRGPEENE